MCDNKQTMYSVFDHGSAWLKADFHLHTKADKVFKYDGEKNQFINIYISELKENRINVGIITNFNAFLKIYSNVISAIENL